MRTFTLNQDQLRALDELKKFETDERQYITIAGFAGTGKTFLIQQWLRTLPKHKRACVTAPTNKATAVLASFGVDAGVRVPALTTYALFGLILDSNSEIRKCRDNQKNKHSSFHYIIIDECSMVGRELLTILLSKLEPHQKLIFMGDQYQINPVNEAISQTFSLAEPCHLTIEERQVEGSPVLELVRRVRNQVITGENPGFAQTELDNDGNGVHALVPGEFEELAAAQFSLDTLEVDCQQNRYLAWRNKTVNSFNAKVRKRLYGVGADDYIVGETLAILSPVLDMMGKPIFFVDDEAVITKVEVTELEDWNDEGRTKYTVWQLHLLGDREQGVVNVLHKRDRAKYTKRCNYLAQEARAGRSNWARFWNFKETFTEVRQVYAMTVHKAQGSTIPNTFLNLNDLMANQNEMEKKRIEYVGCSRASENLILNRKPLSAVTSHSD